MPVHELGVDDEGRMYFTMRLVKGKTLDEIIKLSRANEDGWSRARAIGVMVRVCEAMAYAHAKGVIHRDLKPANIMVGKFGEVYVMDWGLAKVIGRRDVHDRFLGHDVSLMRTQVHTDRLEDASKSADSPLMTLEGTIIGTPPYMPPEQAEGRIDALDPRSDVYSAGALLYTLLTGWMPYVDPDNPITAGRVLTLLLAGPPKPVQELDKAVPAELVSICEKAMSRSPGDRYASMVEMAEDLRAYVENRVVSAHKTGAIAEFRKWVGRNRMIAAVLSLFVVAVVGASVTVAWEQNQRVEEVSAAKRLTDRARARAEANERSAVRNAAAARTNAEKAERRAVGFFLVALFGAHGRAIGFPGGLAGILVERNDVLDVDAVADQDEEIVVDERRGAGADAVLEGKAFFPEEACRRGARGRRCRRCRSDSRGGRSSTNGSRARRS